MSSIKCLTIKKLKFNLPTLLKMPTKQDTLLLIHDFTRNLSFFFSFLNENHDTKPTTTKKKKKTSSHVQSACDETSKILL